MPTEAKTSLLRGLHKRLRKLLTPYRSVQEQRAFRLPERPPRQPAGDLDRRARELARHAGLVEEKVDCWLAELTGNGGQGAAKAGAGTSGPPGGKEEQTPGDLSSRLRNNLARVQEALHQTTSDDVKIRRFILPTMPAREAAVVYIDGLVHTTFLSDSVLKPLMLFARGVQLDVPGEAWLEQVLETLAPHADGARKNRFDELLDAVLAGDSVMFIDGSSEILVFDTKGFEHRGVDTPKLENVVRGPKEAFTENLRVNTSMIRRYLHASDLVVEGFALGRLSRTPASLLYVKKLANPALVEEVRRRVKAIKTDYIAASGMVEQYIEDTPKGLFPTVIATERPDRVAAYLSEGHVALVVSGSPFVLVMPAVFAGWFQTAEDYYIRWPNGTLLRWLRLTGAMIALFLPAFYVAVADYHQEMIPTEMMLAIAASREAVPLPVIAEVLLMEFSFDLIREAGIRIPTVIGPTIGIVGALILGQAAVQASVVSPILVIIVAVTALGTFAIPEYGLNVTIRALHYGMIVFAATLGLYGLGAGFLLLVVSLNSTRSFGVPLLSPLTPVKPSSADAFTRAPIFSLERRPAYTHPEDPQRQRRRQRPWSKENNGKKGSA